MINLDFIATKIGTDRGARKKFMDAIYGEGAAKSINILKGSNPRFETVCKIADYLEVSLDELRTTPPKFKSNHVSGNNNNVGNITINDTVAIENAALKSQIASLEKVIASKDESIEVYKLLVSQVNISKEETIGLYETHSK